MSMTVTNSHWCQLSYQIWQKVVQKSQANHNNIFLFQLKSPKIRFLPLKLNHTQLNRYQVHQTKQFPTAHKMSSKLILELCETLQIQMPLTWITKDKKVLNFSHHCGLEWDQSHSNWNENVDFISEYNQAKFERHWFVNIQKHVNISFLTQ